MVLSKENNKVIIPIISSGIGDNSYKVYVSVSCAEKVLCVNQLCSSKQQSLIDNLDKTQLQLFNTATKFSDVLCSHNKDFATIFNTIPEIQKTQAIQEKLRHIKRGGSGSMLTQTNTTQTLPQRILITVEVSPSVYVVFNGTEYDDEDMQRCQVSKNINLNELETEILKLTQKINSFFQLIQQANIEPEPRDIPQLVIYCDALNACVRSRLRLQIIQQSALEEKNRQQQ